MFNQKIKQEFIQYIDKNEISTGIVEGIFSHISVEEEKRGLDICNINPHEYATILCENLPNINSMSYLKMAYNTLMYYREFCVQRHYINEVIFYSNFSKYKEAVTTDQLYQVLKKHMRSNYVYFYTPDELVNFILDQVYNIHKNQLTSSDKEMSIITTDELTCLYVALIYYGIPQKKCCQIYKENIVNDDTTMITTINFDNRRYYIEGLTRDLLIKANNAKSSMRLAYIKPIFTELNNDWLLSYIADDTEDLRIKRSKKYYNKFQQDCVKFDVKGMPKIKEIINQGVIYQMCKIVHEYDIKLRWKYNLYDLYHEISGLTIAHSSNKSMLKDQFIEHYKYLYGEEPF